MRRSMIQLSGFLGHHRRVVLAGWVVVLVAALPFATRQTEHLTGGGFDVPGSQSQAVSDTVEKDFGADSGGISVLFKAGPGATGAAQVAAVDRVRGAVAGIDGLVFTPAAARVAEAKLRRAGVALAPLRSLHLSADEMIDSASTLRSDLDPGSAEGGVTTYLSGQPTIWAGMQALSKKDLAQAEGLPDRRPDPPRRLRLARGGGAAARARLRQRHGHRGADLLHLPADGDLGLRHQHGLDDRDRGRDRLLAFHPRPLP
jgi:RND superfamily putative drug exporter